MWRKHFYHYMQYKESLLFGKFIQLNPLVYRLSLTTIIIILIIFVMISILTLITTNSLFWKKKIRKFAIQCAMK